MKSNLIAQELLLKIVKCSYFNKCEDINVALGYVSRLNTQERHLLINQLIQLLKMNKFSVTLLSDYEYFIRSIAMSNKFLHEVLEMDSQYMRKYLTILKHVIESLNRNDISYVLIKHYLMQHVKMLDIDIHICDIDEILRACEVLNELGAIFYDFRFFSHPLKLGTKIPSIDPLGEVSIEIYPEISVGRIIVGPSCKFINEAVKVTITDKLNKKLDLRVLPTTENMYTILTHDWYSQTIPLTAIIYFLANVSKCKFNKLLQLGEEYGTLPSVYTFLKLSYTLDKILQLGMIDENVHEMLEKMNFYGKTLIKRWIEELEKKLEFPVRVPYKFILISMPYHITKIARKASIIKVIYDVYSHFTPLLVYLYDLGKKYVHA